MQNSGVLADDCLVFCVRSLEVLPRAGSARLATDPLRKAQDAKWRQRLLQVLWRYRQEDRDKKAIKLEVAKCRDQRKKAFVLMLAMDHQLECIGRGLHRYQVSPATRSKPLSSSEERYWVPDPSPPTGSNVPPGVQTGRWAVRDRVTKQKRWEAPRPAGERPVLNVVSDHGSDIEIGEAHASVARGKMDGSGCCATTVWRMEAARSTNVAKGATHKSTTSRQNAAILTRISCVRRHAREWCRVGFVAGHTSWPCALPQNTLVKTQSARWKWVRRSLWHEELPRGDFEMAPSRPCEKLFRFHAYGPLPDWRRTFRIP